VLSSKNESKVEERFQARIELLTERLDTLATTVATTASAIAKKDGEIASLRRELGQRDEQIQALAARTQAAAGGADPRALDELRRTVEALANERSKQAGTKQIDQLSDKLALLGQRLETLSATVSTTAAGLAGRDGELASLRKQLEARPVVTGTGAADPELKRQVDELGAAFAGTRLRVEGQANDIQALKAQLADPAAQAPAVELRAMLTTLRGQVESLDGLRSGVTEERLDERLAETSDAVETLARRVEALSEKVRAATASLSDKEHELAALNRHFTESSTRIESIVDDLREALGAFPDAGPDALAAVASKVDATVAGLDAAAERLDRLEESSSGARVVELGARLESLDKRVSSVAAEIARAKTLWPVALRSLEARLEDVAAARAHDAATAPEAALDPDDSQSGAQDLLAGLRDSLHAMESVAAEMGRAPEPEPATTPASEEAPVTSEPTPTQAMVAGARIVPLRTSDP
jgi:chromosome segregation ATPase